MIGTETLKATLTAGTTDPIVGIDLGTTNSLVAIVKNGSPSILTSSDCKRLVPSVVAFVDGKLAVGFEAKKQKVRHAKHTAFSVKRLLGRGLEDITDITSRLPYKIVPGDGGVRIELDGRSYSAVEITSMILKQLKSIAEQALGKPVSKAVITVPAYFNDSQRQATRTAGKLAGWDVLRIINEPTAASLAYGIDRRKQGIVAVFDLGGGTFDISILKLHAGIFEVLSTNGDTALGGDDLDQALAEVAAKEIKAKWGIDPVDDGNLHASLLEAAENTKIALSWSKEAVFEVPVKGDIYRRTWTLDEFESLARTILERTRKPCEIALKDAGIASSDLTAVVMVGGPTRLRIVQEFAREIFGKEPDTSVHPDEVVALGAAIQADILAGNNKDLLLLDVVPLSLGLETYGGLMSTLIPRNTKIPAVAREVFTTFVDDQTAVDIHVLQGERERAQDNRSLARFKLKLKPAPAGFAKVEVSFLTDADGILQVSAEDLETGDQQSMEVGPSFGLTDEEVEKMLLASAQNAEDDVAYRRLAEARNDAERILISSEARLTDARRLLSEDETSRIQFAITELKLALHETNVEEIKRARVRLNDVTGRLADLIIAEAVG